MIPHRVHLSYRLAGTARGPGEAEQQGERLAADTPTLPHPLFDLLGAVAAQGSIKQAAQALGVSYRHAWGALKQWEQAVGQPLVVWARGQPGRLTPFGWSLMWAETRARARLAPQVDALRLGLEQALAQASAPPRSGHSAPPVVVHLAHDPLWVALAGCWQAAGLPLRLHFTDTASAMAALAAGRCDAALLALPRRSQPAPRWWAAARAALGPGVDLRGFVRWPVVQRDQGWARRPEAPTQRAAGPAPRAQPWSAGLEAHWLTGQLREQLREPVLEQLRGDAPGGGADAALARALDTALDTARRRPDAALAAEDTADAVAAAVAAGAADLGLVPAASARRYGLAWQAAATEDVWLFAAADAPAVARVQPLADVLAGAAWAQAHRQACVAAPPHATQAPLPGHAGLDAYGA